MPSRKPSQTADPSKTPIHTCWQECECEGCKKMRKDKTPNEHRKMMREAKEIIGFEKGLKVGLETNKTLPASKENPVTRYLSDNEIIRLENNEVNLTEDWCYHKGKSEGRRETVEFVERSLTRKKVVRPIFMNKEDGTKEHIGDEKFVWWHDIEKTLQSQKLKRGEGSHNSGYAKDLGEKK